jgi:trehalose 6-phosphate phosphatase
MPYDFTVPAPDLREVAILLDVDGTILDLAATPGEVSVPPSLRQTLQRLWDRTSGALAFVSGRRVRDIDEIFAPLRLPAVGGHGAEFRALASGKPEHSPRPLLDPDLRHRLAEIATAHPGILVEDKGYSVALHYRLAPEMESFVLKTAAAVCADSLQMPVELLPGKSMVEVKEVGFNKASGVRKLMKIAPFAHRRPIFFGDDTTDEDVFAIMPEYGGIAVAVGEKFSGHANHMDRPADVRCWLEHVSRNGEFSAS